MANPVPSDITLTTINDGDNIDAAPLRNNFSTIAAAVNALAAALRGGSAGQALAAVDASDVQWGDYALLASPAFTGTPTAPTPATGDNSTQIATTAWVKAQGYGGGVTSFNGRTGAVTPASGDYSSYYVAQGGQTTQLELTTMLVLDSKGSDQVSGSGVGILYVKSGHLYYREPANGTIHELA